MMRPDRNLERELRELGRRIEYPPTPDLSQAVRARLDERGEPAPRRIWSPQWWAAAAAAVLLLIAAPLLSQEVRDTATGWFVGGQASSGGQAGSGAEEASSPIDEATLMDEGVGPQAGAPQANRGQPMAASGGGARPSRENPRYGESIPLRDAPVWLAGSQPLLPRLGLPDEVYAGGPPRDGGVVLVYRADRGLPSSGGTGTTLVLTEVPGNVESVYFRGRVPGAAGAEEVSVDSGRGHWVPAGRRSPIMDRAGVPPGNVLFWEREGLALRLAADLPQREMIRIAESVR